MNFKEYVNNVLNEEQDILSLKAKAEAKKRGLVHQSHNIWKDNQGNEFKWDVQTKRFIKDTTGRAWNNKLDKINDFLSYTYNSMKSSDKKLKDSVFRAYYRYYNDGDILSLPTKSLEKLGIEQKYLTILDAPKYMKGGRKYEEALEKSVEVVMKYLLQKYKNKISHKEVNFSQLKDIKDKIERENYTGYYWLQKFGEKVKNDELIGLANKLKDINKDVIYTYDRKSLDKTDENKAKEIVNSIFNKRKIVKECEEILNNVIINENIEINESDLI